MHNLGYWERRPYLGLGAGAHSFRDDRRWWNVRPPQEYLSIVESGRLPVGGNERLEPSQAHLEEVFLRSDRHAGPGSSSPCSPAVARRREAPLSRIAKDFGISEACLHRWLKMADVEDGLRPGITQAEAAEMRELKKPAIA